MLKKHIFAWKIDGKRLFSHENFFPQLKSLFLSFSQANMNFFVWTKNILSGQMSLCLQTVNYKPNEDEVNLR